MRFESAVIDGDKITLSKQEIEQAYKHLCKVADQYKPKKLVETYTDPKYFYYKGRVDTLLYILDCFEEKEANQ